MLWEPLLVNGLVMLIGVFESLQEVWSVMQQTKQKWILVRGLQETQSE
jgi:hypothetical protein